MILVDSVGWIEFFTDGPLAASYAKHLQPISEVVVPTVVLYEVYKKIKREKSEEEAFMAAVQMQRGRVVPLTDELSLSAADLSLHHHLPMADAIVYATALQEKAKLATSDKDLKDLPQVIYYSKSS